MATVGYVRVSTGEQSVEAQKHSIEQRHKVDRWFEDAAVSGAIRASERPGFGKLLEFVRDGDLVVVGAIDRLGRNTLDVLHTVELLQGKGATVLSIREGFDLGTPIGKAMLTMLAAVAELERANIKARQMAGIERAKAQGVALGRPAKVDLGAVAAWRREQGASIADTAAHFGISTATVKRACAGLRGA